MMDDLRALARALGGDVVGNQALCPGPGHSRRDRSLSVKLSATSPDGFIAHSHSGDDWRECRDYVAGKLGLDPNAWRRNAPRRPTGGSGRPPASAGQDDDAESERAKAGWLWRQGRPTPGTAAETYLRRARGYTGIIPATLSFLPARREHPPALIAAFGMATEPEPGTLSIADGAVMAVQLVKLKPDGSGKTDVEPNKIIVGRGALGSPIVLAPPNDLLGLAITEGIEDGLSIHRSTGLGAWASGGATRMPALADAVPEYINFVTIVADPDPSGIKGANGLSEGLRRRGINTLWLPRGASRHEDGRQRDTADSGPRRLAQRVRRRARGRGQQRRGAR